MEICARLVDEPFCLRKDEIGKLDRWWVYNVYFRARDKDGRHVVRPKGKVDAEIAGAYSKTAFYAYYEERGAPQWHIDSLWNDYKKECLE